MKTSTTITKLSVALLKTQQEMGDAVKGSKNPFFKSSYADLNAIREAILPVANKNGLTVLQPTTEVNGKNYVETIILDESGEWASSLTEIKNPKGDAQSEGSGISYARRYGLQSFFNVGAVDDDAEGVTVRSTTKTDTPTAASFRKSSAGTNGTKTVEPVAETDGWDT